MTSGPLRLAFAGFALLGMAVTGAYLYDRSVRRPATSPAPPPPSAAREHAATHVPDRRPAFALKDTAGRLHDAAEWDGKALLVNFWATWCAPCRREIPLLNRIRREYAGRGVEVVGIAVDFPEDVIAYRQRFPIDYPLLVGEEDGLDAARAFGVEPPVFPFTAFTDSRGRVLTLHVGELHEAEVRAILKIVAEVEAGALTPLEARAAIRSALAALPKAPSPPAG